MSNPDPDPKQDLDIFAAMDKNEDHRVTLQAPNVRDGGGDGDDDGDGDGDGDHRVTLQAPKP